MTVRNVLASVSLSVLLLVAGCRKAAPPKLTVCLLDISQSIYPEAVRDEFAAMDKLADHLRRGDKLVIIPIVGDARNDVQGHIVRLRAPEQRLAFDGDLTRFHEEAHEKIAGLRAWAISHPSAHTDILGTLEVAQQENIASLAHNSNLILLSDFLEDDDKWNFVTNHALDSPALVRRLADSARLHTESRFSSIFLGQVRSRDSQEVSASRWDAIETFWGELLRLHNKQIAIHIDGINALAENADAVEP